MARFKKYLIIALVIPAGLIWYWFSFLAVTIYGHAFMGSIQIYYLVAFALMACGFITVAIYNAIKYPKMTNASVYICGFGSSFLAVGLISGMSQEPIILAASISLILATAIFILDYIKQQKTLKITKHA